MAIKKHIIIGAGHGGRDGGAVSGKRVERDECIVIVNKLAQLLRADGRIKVTVVPHSYALGQSIDFVNRTVKGLNDAIAIEVHRNSCGCGASGYETWHGSSQDSKELSIKLHNEIIKTTKLKNRGVKNHKTNRHGKLGWIADTNCWALLTECGFIDKDPHLYDEFAQGHYNGILKMFGLGPKPAPKPKLSKVVQHYRDTHTGMRDTYHAIDKANAMNMLTMKPTSVSYESGDPFDAVATFKWEGERWYVSDYSHKRALKADYLNAVREKDFMDGKGQEPSAPPVEDYPQEPREEDDETDDSINGRLTRLENIAKILTDLLSSIWGYLGSALAKLRKDK